MWIYLLNRWIDCWQKRHSHNSGNKLFDGCLHSLHALILVLILKVHPITLTQLRHKTFLLHDSDLELKNSFAQMHKQSNLTDASWRTA